MMLIVNPFLNIILHGRNLRRAFVNLRQGTPAIVLEKGRQTSVKNESRFCKICNTGKIEMGEQFVFGCPAFASTRKPVIDRFSSNYKKFTDLSQPEKMKFSLYVCDTM